MARLLDVPSMAALSWVDTKSVHILSTGAALCEVSVARRTRGGAVSSVRCPRVVADYHHMMCGVDRHDQFRLQIYSLQTSFRFQQCYKGLFLGLLDLAMVSAYVTHVECAKRAGV